MKHIVRTAAFLALCAAPAAAAEPGSYDWSGFYVGAFGSYLSGTATGVVTAGGAGSDSFAISGLQAGGLAGYNWQSERFVIGLEADAGFGNIDGIGFDGGINDFDIDPQGHARVRLGMAIDRFLPFLATGLTIADGDARSPGFGSPSELHFGWTIGAGLDFAVTDNFLVRGEYIFDRAGTETYTYGPGDIDFSFDNSNFRLAATLKF